MVNSNIQKLLNKKMGRREFLAHIGAGALAITGISGLLKNLVDFGRGPRRRSIADGYGSSPYGGQKR